VTRSGNQYKASVNYHIKDFYRWKADSNLEAGPLMLDYEMAQLHAVGLAREYQQYGTITFTLKGNWRKAKNISLTERG
jgi:hypothetical protein